MSPEDELGELRIRLHEAESTLAAIRHGEIDAIVVAGPGGDRIFTLHGEDEAYRVLVETMSEGAATLAADGTVLYANRSMADLVGYPLGELIGAAFPSLLGGIDPGPVGRLLAGGAGAEPVTAALRHRDGSAVPVVMSSRTLPGDGPAVVCVVATDLSAVVAEAERAARAKSDLLSRTSHELRTPLNAIVGFGQLLRLQDLTPEQLAWVDHVLVAGRHLEQLVDGLLTLERAESARLALSLVPVPVDEVVGEALDLFRAGADGADVTVGRSGAAGLSVMADRLRLKEILVNLVSNGVKYNRPGGSVTVGVTGRPGTASGDRVVISVADTGPGIDPDGLTRIFEPSERLGAETTPIPGTGLGLTLARELASAMGGSVTAASLIGTGSTFTLDLPAADGRAAPGAPPRTSRSYDERLRDLGAFTVLCIEDSVVNLQAMEAVLSRSPHVRVLAAGSGREGLEIAASAAPDVILLDLHLPDLDGTEVLRRLGADTRTSTIPAVVLSADVSASARTAALELGARAHLGKPFDLLELTAALEQVLAGSGTVDGWLRETS